LLSVVLQNSILQRSAAATLGRAGCRAPTPVLRPALAAGLAAGVVRTRLMLGVLVAGIRMVTVVVAVLGVFTAPWEVPSAGTTTLAAGAVSTTAGAVSTTAGAVAILPGRRSDHQVDLGRNGEQQE
jgi:hypothetical protein